MGILSKLSALALIMGCAGGVGAAAQAPLLPPDPLPDRQVIYPIDRLEQRDTDGDGRIDETRIYARIYTDADLITVIDGGADMQRSADWRSATDFRNDTWIFDVGAEGGAELLIAFQTDAQNRISANVYPDTTGDRVVSYRRDPAEGITVREGAIGTAAAFRPTPPSIVLTVQDDWYLPDGTLNYALTIFMDGSHLSLRDNSTYTMNFMTLWDQFSALDGTPDQQYEVFDAERDGIIDAVVWRLLAPTPQGISAARSWLWRNVGGVRSLPMHDHFFFPYFSPYDSAAQARRPLYAQLGAAQVYPDLRYFDQPPGFEINWELARVTPVVFRGYPIEDGFHVGVNLNYLEPDIVNYANFENQQAYYDLAGDDDNAPELHLRHRYFAAEDPDGWELPRPINEIRWSWNQANGDGVQFDYKLSLGGRAVLDEVVEVGGYRLNVVPYDQLGGWILDQPWDIATFVAVEGRPYLSSEGIYEWNAIEHNVGGWNGTVSAYLAGNLTIDLGREHTSAPPLMRGEFVDPLNGAPQLYFSGVDGKLHLLHAEFCVWNVDGVREIRCDNLDGDPYFDYWYATNEPRPLPEVTSVSNYYGLNIEPYLPSPDQQLVLLDGYLLYADPNNVYLRAESIESALFTVPPPYTTDGWRALDALLTEHQFDDPALSADLAALYDRFTTPDLRIKNARASAFRPAADGGIRFFLDLLPGFEVDNRLGLVVGDLSEGRYRVRVREGVFTLDPLSPPDVRVSLEYPFVELPTFETVTTIPLNIVVENRGMTDVPVLRYRVFTRLASDPDAAPRIVWDSVAAAPAESTVVLPIEWLPLDAGDWTVEVLLESVTIPSLDVLLADYTKLDNIGDIAALFPVAQAPLNPQGETAVTGSRTFTVVPVALPASTLITLNGQQPLNGILIIALLAAVTVLGVGVAVLVLRQTE